MPRWAPVGSKLLRIRRCPSGMGRCLSGHYALCVELRRKGLQVVAVMSNIETTNVILLGAVSLTYLSILKEGFTPIFSATLSYGKSVSP